MDEEDQEGNAVATALSEMTSRYTTPEAQGIARTTFKELYGERGKVNEEEQRQLNALDAVANDAKEALKSARQKMLQQRWNESQKWYGLAAALGKPTESGSFGESLGNAGASLQQSSKAKRDWQDNRDLAVLKNQLDTGQIDVDLAKARLAAIKARREADDKLATESLKVLGREIRPGRGTGAAGMSPFGKIAADEGLEPGSPAFNHRVNQLYNADMKQRQQAAGVDVQEVNPQDQQILAEQYGVPLSPMDPYRGLSTKAKQVAREQNMKQGQQQLAALNDQDAVARGAIRQIDRFMNLNEQQKSGKLYGLPLVSWLTGFSTAAQEMDSITADIARHQRQPGEGTVSNYDATQFLIASPGRGKSYATNDNIGKAIKTAKQQQLEQSEFLSNYLAVNGHMQGAKEAWNRYLEANPIFDPAEKSGSFVLNKGRLDYKSWFRQQQPPKPLAATSDEGDVEVSVGQDPVDRGDDTPVGFDPLEGLTEEQKKWAQTPAKARGGKVGYAEGGKVSGLRGLVSGLDERIGALQRKLVHYTSPDSDEFKRLKSELDRLSGLKETGQNTGARLDVRMAGGGKVDIAKRLEMLRDATAGARLRNMMRINLPSPAPITPPPVNPSMQGIAQKRDALLRVLTDSKKLSPVEANGAQQANLALQQTLQATDAGAGMRAEQFMRQLQDLASKYGLRYAEGGKVDEKKAAKERGYRSLMAQLAREIAQGGTYNFSDELLSGGDPEALQDQRAALEEFGDQNPAGAISAQLAGAVPTGMAAGYGAHKLIEAMKGSGPTFHPKLGMRRGKAATVASALERFIPKSAIGKMAASGAVSGAVAGAGASQGDRGSDAAEGSVLGALIGPLAGVGSKYALGAGRRMLDYVRGTTPSPSVEKLLSTFARDTTNLDDIPKKMAANQRLRVPTMMGDIPGQNTSALVEAVAGKSGEGPARLADKIAARQGKIGERVEDAVNRGLKPSDYRGETKTLTDALYTNAKPLYEAAYQKSPPIPVKAITWLYDSKIGTKAMKDAVQLMRAEGIPIGKKDMFKSARKLSLQSLDYTKRALDDMITKEEGSGANYAATNKGRVLRAMRDKLRGTLDASSPDYLAARQQYAGDLEVLDALRAGKEMFPKLNPKDLAALVQPMSFAEKDAFRTGAAEHLFDQISKSPRGSNVAGRVVGTPALSEKLAVLFDNPKEAAKFNEALLKEYSLFKQSTPAITNAARTRAANAGQGLDETPLTNAADLALDVGQQAVFLPGVAQNTGGPWTTARILQWVRNRMPMAEQTANEVADTLGIDDPAKAAQAIAKLKAEGERLAKRKAVSDAVSKAAARSTPVALSPDPWAQGEEKYGDGGKVRGLSEIMNSIAKRLGPKTDQKLADLRMKKMREEIPEQRAERIARVNAQLEREREMHGGTDADAKETAEAEVEKYLDEMKGKKDH